MMYKNIILDIKDNGIALLTLNRPEQYNSINKDLREEFIQALADLAQNPQAKVVVITGSGKGFCGGGDISAISKLTDANDAKRGFDGAIHLLTAIYEMEKPVITALNGTAGGIGNAIAMASDLVVASSGAHFAFNFINIGLCPDSGSSYFLTQKVGYNKAAEILFLGKILTAEEAHDLGIINTVVDPEEVLPTAMAWAEKLLKSPLYTLGLDKKLLRAAITNDFYKQAELESLYQVLAWSSEDSKEGFKAFKEKRKPHFIGR